MKSQYAPILITTVNRYEHLKRCIDSLKNNTLANESDLYIAVDYPPSDKYWEGYSKVKEYVPSITGFKTINIIWRDRNYGIMSNLNSLIDQVRNEGYECYFMTEDDNEFSVGALSFINWGLKIFENNEKIIYISTSGDRWVLNDKPDYFYAPMVSCYGIATWFKKEDLVLSKINDKWWNSIFQNRKKSRELFYKSPAYYYYYASDLAREIPITRDENDKLTTVDFCRNVVMQMENYYCVFPTDTMVRNWGYDGTGSNCGDRQVDVKKKPLSEIEDWNKEYLPVDEKRAWRNWKKWSKHNIMPPFRRIVRSYLIILSKRYFGDATFLFGTKE